MLALPVRRILVIVSGMRDSGGIESCKLRFVFEYLNGLDCAAPRVRYASGCVDNQPCRAGAMSLNA